MSWHNRVGMPRVCRIKTKPVLHEARDEQTLHHRTSDRWG
jgi:hypothetical protein